MMRRIHRPSIARACGNVPPMLVSEASDCRTKLKACSSEAKRHFGIGLALSVRLSSLLQRGAIHGRIGDGTHYMRGV
jgi:hypothetical protein